MAIINKILTFLLSLIIIFALPSMSVDGNSEQENINEPIKFRDIYNNINDGPWLNRSNEVDLEIDLIVNKCKIQSDILGKNYTINLTIIGTSSGCDGIWIGYNDGTYPNPKYNNSTFTDYYWIQEEIELYNIQTDSNIFYKYYIYQDLSLNRDWSRFYLSISMECRNASLLSPYNLRSLIYTADEPSWLYASRIFGIEKKVLMNGYNNKSGFQDEWKSLIVVYGFIDNSNITNFQFSQFETEVEIEYYGQIDFDFDFFPPMFPIFVIIIICIPILLFIIFVYLIIKDKIKTIKAKKKEVLVKSQYRKLG